MTPGPTITIRTATGNDAEAVSDLVHALIDELSGGKAPAPAVMAATARDLLAGDAVFGLLACDGDVPVGVLMLNECAAIYAGGRFGEISELYVKPEYRSRKVASKLVDAAITFAAKRAWTRLEVGAPDQPAWNRTLSFYLREGFAEVGPRLKKSIA